MNYHKFRALKQPPLISSQVCRWEVQAWRGKSSAQELRKLKPGVSRAVSCGSGKSQPPDALWVLSGFSSLSGGPRSPFPDWLSVGQRPRSAPRGRPHSLLRSPLHLRSQRRPSNASHSSTPGCLSLTSRPSWVSLDKATASQIISLS